MTCKNKFWRLTLDTNPEDCNYHCIMCEEHSPYSRFMDELYGCTGARRRRMPVEWISPLMSEAAALGAREVIPSTMGEPLLYEGIDSIFECAEKCGLAVNLTTNGSFPKRAISEWTQLIVPRSRDVKISINGAKRETSESIMHGSDFDTQLSNIGVLIKERDRCFKENGWYCSVTLQLTFMQCNMCELSDIVKLACALGADRIKGHHLWTHFREIEHLSMKANQFSIEKWNQYVTEAHQTLDKHAVALPNGRKLRLENITRLSSADGGEAQSDAECPFLGNELWISATGRISPCCCPDKKRRTLGDFGHYPFVSIRDVLQSEDYRRLLSNYMTMDVCKTCNMRRPK